MRRLLFADNTLFLTCPDTLCVQIQCWYNTPKPNKYTASWYNVDTKRACVLDMQIATLDRQVGRGASCILRRTLVGGNLNTESLNLIPDTSDSFLNFFGNHLHFCFPFLLVIFHKCWIYPPLQCNALFPMSYFCLEIAELKLKLFFFSINSDSEQRNLEEHIQSFGEFQHQFKVSFSDHC